MAKYKTSEEAVLALSKELQAKQNRLAQLESTTDPVLKKQAEQVRDEIRVLGRKLAIESMSMEGLFGKAKVAGIGALVGLPKGITTLIDLAAQGGQQLDRLLPDFPGKLTPRKDLLLTPRIAPGYEASSRESAPAFGLGEGAGMSAVGGPTQMAVGGATRATDEAFFEGTPVTQLTAAAYMISRAVANGVKNWQDNRGVKKLLDQLGPDAPNKLRKFMLRGQDSTDPIVAGTIAQLRRNPAYAEIFNVLETQATKEATKFARVGVKPGYPVEKTGQGIYQAIDGEVQRLRENITLLPKSKFEAAKKMGGNNDILFTNNTVNKIDDLIDSFSKQGTDDAAAAVQFLNRFKGDIAGKSISVEKMQALLSEFGAQAKKGESLITNVSLGSQEKIATSIFSGLKDDLVNTAQNSSVPRIREISRLLDAARKDVKNGYDSYNAFIAQGLPAKLKNVNINAVDTDELLNTVKGLSNAQRDRMAAILENTAPEDLKRIRQVMYDDFTQSARTVLPDGSTGVDLKLLANKFNTLPEQQRQAVAFAVGTRRFDDFSERMKDAENFFKYQQKFGGEAGATGLTASEISEISTAGFLAGNYTTGRTAGLVGRLYNQIKGGLSDEKTLNFLLSPETKGLLRETITNPNSVRTVERVSKVLGDAPVAAPAVMGASYVARTGEEQQPVLEPWDIGPTETPITGGSVTVQGAPAEFNTAPAQPMQQPMQQPELEEWDIGPAR